MILVSQHVRTATDRDGVIILDIARDMFLSLNQTGAYIWGRLVEGEPPEHIATSLASDTGTNISVVSADVREFIVDLEAKHLIRFHA